MVNPPPIWYNIRQGKEHGRETPEKESVQDRGRHEKVGNVMTFGELIESLGERLGVVIENAGGAAAVEIGDVVVILQDAGELLLLRAEIGELPDEGRYALAAAAMRANFLYQGTGGATLALDPDSDRLHLQKYNWMEKLEPDAALDMLERFADTVATWTCIVADYRPDAEANHAPPPPIAPGPFLQV